MKIAALITWLITAGGGFYLLGTWLTRGGVRQQQTRTTRFPAPLIFGHFLLAVAGLVVWIVYLATDKESLTWTAFIILLIVAALGFTMFARWLPMYRARSQAGAGARPRAGTSAGPGATPAADATEPAERHFPVSIVAIHGLLAATTLILVLLTALGVGESS